MYPHRIVSGMRPTGALHLGHYHGVLKNWIKLQCQFSCLFFVADCHALTTHYSHSTHIVNDTWEMLIDWFAAGINPERCTLFIQSRVPEHAQLYLLLSMLMPLGWLERVPTYKDQQEKLIDRDLSTYGFLGYPLLQAADILIYRATRVPVGEDQVPHIEMAREVARRFNYLYEKGFQEKVAEAVKKLGSKQARLYRELCLQYQEKADEKALEEVLKKAKTLVDDVQNLSMIDRERLFRFLKAEHKLIEPCALLTKASRLPGLNGQKMSKSYGNTIALRDHPSTITKKIRRMPTDPARVHRSDPGEPEKCPVWQFHLVYSDNDIKSWVGHGCRTAKIGCLDCKQPLIDAIIQEQIPMLERAQPYLDDLPFLRAIVADGSEKARKLAQNTLRDVREVIGLP